MLPAVLVGECRHQQQAQQQGAWQWAVHLVGGGAVLLVLVAADAPSAAQERVRGACQCSRCSGSAWCPAVWSGAPELLQQQLARRVCSVARGWQQPAGCAAGAWLDAAPWEDIPRATTERRLWHIMWGMQPD